MYLINSYQFWAGDIGLSSSKGWMSKVIKFLTSWQTGKATKTHSFVCVLEDLIVEATNKISLNSIDKYASPNFPEVDVYRLPLDDEDRDRLRQGLLNRVNWAYGWLKLPLFALDAITTKLASLIGRKTPIFFFTKTFGISNIPVCSQLVVWAIHKHTSYMLRDKDGKMVNWKTVSPDFLEDLLKISHNGCYKIYSK